MSSGMLRAMFAKLRSGPMAKSVGSDLGALKTGAKFLSETKGWGGLARPVVGLAFSDQTARHAAMAGGLAGAAVGESRASNRPGATFKSRIGGALKGAAVGAGTVGLGVAGARTGLGMVQGTAGIGRIKRFNDAVARGAKAYKPPRMPF